MIAVLALGRIGHCHSRSTGFDSVELLRGRPRLTGIIRWEDAMRRAHTAPILVVLALLLLVGLACSRPAKPTPTGSQPIATPGPAPVTLTPTPTPPAPVDGYVALAPSVFRMGQAESVSLSLFSGQRPTTGRVVLTLLKDGAAVALAAGDIKGTGTLNIQVPNVAAGDYTLQVTGQSFSNSALVRVQDGAIVFVETDKPIYKPGQTVHMRVLALDAELKPLARSVAVEVQDAKGTKVFRKEVATDDYGMATLDLPLSTEPNLGVWKVTARAGDRTAQVDVRVERVGAAESAA